MIAFHITTRLTATGRGTDDSTHPGSCWRPSVQPDRSIADGIEIAEPPLKLVLLDNADGGSTINHLGVETESADEVVAAEARLAAAGLETSGVGDTTCCFADTVETWVYGPDSMRWEWYLKAADRDEFGTNTPGVDGVIAVVATAGGNACRG